MPHQPEILLRDLEILSDEAEEGLFRALLVYLATHSEEGDTDEDDPALLLFLASVLAGYTSNVIDLMEEHSPVEPVPISGRMTSQQRREVVEQVARVAARAVSEAGGDPAFLSGEADQKRTARARHIAESVITSVRSEIQMILARRMGLMFKTWRTRLDTVVRPAHRKLEGVTILIDDRFQTIGGTISYPGDLTARLELRANCRCLMSFGTELPGGNR